MPPYEWNSAEQQYAKYCPRCKKDYLVGAEEDRVGHNLSKFFAQDRATADGFYGRCRDCVSEFQRNRRGGRVCDGEQILAAQGGKCPICEKELSFKREGAKVVAYIDHCHATNKVRGVLCVRCNTQLAQIEDANWLVKAQAYLERYK